MEAYPTRYWNRSISRAWDLLWTQPPLRGFGWGLTTIFVRISEDREEVSLLGYRTKLSQLIQRITEAYWAVTYATENVRVQEKAIELADTLLRDAEAKVGAGLFASIASPKRGRNERGVRNR